jgi:signal transduction histidine kinase
LQVGGVTTALVNDLLLLSRLDAGRLELAPEPLDLPTFLGDLVRQAQPLAEQHGP